MTTEKKYCYRYVDGNDSEGRPIVMLWTQVILRETDKTFWYCPDYPQMNMDQLRQYQSRPGNRQIKRSLKGAARSKYHYTKEEALRAFTYRKIHQLERIQLTAETVKLCLKGLGNAGFLEKNDEGNIGIFAKVLDVPADRFIAADEPGPIASTYSWGEY